MSGQGDRPRLGFIGLGTMGAPMARQLAMANHELAVFDIDPAPAAHLASSFAQVRAAASPADAAKDADIVLTMLPTWREVREVTLGENGLIEAMLPGTLLIDSSSSDPSTTRDIGAQLEVRGAAMVDAPVSGGAVAANAADLVFMLGGRPEDVERAKAVLVAIGQRIFHLGPLGSGHMMKSINNAITSVILVATGEGLLAGKAMGLDPEVMNKVLVESTGSSWIAHNHIAQRIVSRSFDEAFRLDLMVKDIDIAASLAAQGGISQPVRAAAEAVWRAALDAMPAGSNVSHVVRHMEMLSGIELTPHAASPASGGAPGGSAAEAPNFPMV